MGLPKELFYEDASPQDKALLTRIEEDLEAVRMDETAAYLYPWLKDSQGNELSKFELVTARGTETRGGEAIMRYAIWSAMVALSDFMMTGHNNVGANNLTLAKQDLFVAALKSIVDSICDVFNQYGFPRLLRQNGLIIPIDESPKLRPGKIMVADLNQLGTYIQRLSASGFDMFPSDTLEDFLLETAGMPRPTDAERAEARALGLAEGPNNNQQGNDAPPGGQAPNPRRRRARQVPNTNREGQDG
jgi:hypothetical protein